jgi:hypothetical protein
MLGTMRGSFYRRIYYRGKEGKLSLILAHAYRPVSISSSHVLRLRIYYSMPASLMEVQNDHSYIRLLVFSIIRIDSLSSKSNQNVNSTSATTLILSIYNTVLGVCTPITLEASLSTVKIVIAYIAIQMLALALTPLR